LPFRIVRYEDLKANPGETLRSIYDDFGFSIPQEVVDKSVALSSFSSMKALEHKYGYGGRPIGKKFQFMRRGTSGEWATSLSGQDCEYIIRQAGHTMKALGYE
jgi:hypothetical protein